MVAGGNREVKCCLTQAFKAHGTRIGRPAITMTDIASCVTDASGRGLLNSTKGAGRAALETAVARSRIQQRSAPGISLLQGTVGACLGGGARTAATLGGAARVVNAGNLGHATQNLVTARIQGTFGTVLAQLPQFHS